MLKNTPALNEEQITTFLKEAIEAVKTEEDPDILNAYRKIFRKNVPFTLRSYIAAYLIKEFEASSFSRARPYNRRSNVHADIFPTELRRNARCSLLRNQSVFL